MASASTALHSAPDRIFVANKSVRGQIAGTWAVGMALLAVCIFLTIAAALTPYTTDNTFRPGLSGGFIAQLITAILGVFAILRGIFLLRTTRRLVLNADGARIDSWISKRFVRWDAVARIRRTKRPVPYTDKTIQAIELLAANQQRLAVITDTLEDFATLADELMALPAAAESSAIAETEKAQAIAKERRRLRKIAFGFLFFAVGMAAALVAGINEEWHTRQLAKNGVHVEATVVRAWMVRVTPWVEFSFHDATGRTFSRQATMYEGPEWEKLKTAKTVDVFYLPSSPDWNHINGEDQEAQFGGSFLFLTSGGLLMFGTLFVTTLLGYNLKRENGVAYLTRNGEVIRQWKQA